ncbi:HFX_2341 family transcriptional regulator domain-containing protein [Archaeoglobus veneficus]|uniref:CRISPR locus-related DNA-binding protein n=1 Tax=Archaeoglobus veneficus (strain DSM 11195 / SNP6) TaxID=693661 RepID=F2KS31_ARCVS|nr:DUF6293 family protein [Archaeoglobus veneficus]AEA46872.1 hypothetical protein Arcve_0858 [Archaeoglobus veneficus SNP6]
MFTITSITMKILRVVHIIPLGFERSIVTRAIRKIGGEKVHILSIGPENARLRDPDLYKKQQYFTYAVINDLRKMGYEVEFHDVDLFNFESALSKISELIVQEKTRGARVYINISAFGRLIAVVASLAGWYHDCTVYYVEPDRYYENEEEFFKYGRSVCIDPEIIELPKIEIAKLSEEERFTLSFLINKGGQAKTDEILKALEKKFQEFKIECKDRSEYRREYQKVINKLNRRILDKLESKKYIERIKAGRYNRIDLTDEGKIIALLERGTF